MSDAPALTIRQANIDDAAIVAALHVESTRKGYADFADAAYLDGLDVGAFTAKWTKWLGDSTTVLIAFDGNDGPDVQDGTNNKQIPAGFIAFGPIRTRIHEDRGIMPAWPGEIYALYVAPDYWGSGTARTLMKAAVTPMQKSYLDRALLWVIDRNKRAVKFYEKCGGQRVGKQKVNIGGQDVTEIAFGWRDIGRV